MYYELPPKGLNQNQISLKKTGVRTEIHNGYGLRQALA
jgi:hypothetical protein